MTSLYRNCGRSHIDVCIHSDDSCISKNALYALKSGKSKRFDTNHTSHIASLYMEADGPSIYSRREKLSLQYAIRLAANQSNPAHEVTFPTKIC